MTRQDEIVRLLREAPATCGELAVILGMSSPLAGAHLCDLRRKGRVRVRNSRIESGGRPARLWEAA